MVYASIYCLTPLHHGVHRIWMDAAAATNSLARDPGTAISHHAQLYPTLPYPISDNRTNSFNQTQNLFHTYAQFAALNKPPPNPTEEELRLESQLKDLLEQVRYRPPTAMTAPQQANTPPARFPRRPTHPPPRLRSNPHIISPKTKLPLPPP